MKLALIGQDIPMLLPSFLTDALFAAKVPVSMAMEESNPAMRMVCSRYGAEIIKKSGLDAAFTVTDDRSEVLDGADAVIYAGDFQAASRFRQDREALSGVSDDDPGLSDQARVNGGIGGLMHTLRQGETIYSLCEVMKVRCPNAIVITLGQPVARTCEMFRRSGFAAYGLSTSPLRGSGGLDFICTKLKKKPNEVTALIAGLTDFAFLLKIKGKDSKSLLSQCQTLAKKETLGRLAARWLDWYGAIPVGNVTRHAEFLPAQPDYEPERDPAFGETIERRKERILCMNTIGDKGHEDRESKMAQMMLLAKVPAVRPVQLALALLMKADLTMPAVTRVNGRTMAQLSPAAIIEAPLTLKKGEDKTPAITLPDALAEVMTEIDLANRLAAQAAEGDRSALRELLECDPALEGVDRLYCRQLVDSLIVMHGDMLKRFEMPESPDTDDTNEE